jgi:hypothetical protein
MGSSAQNPGQAEVFTVGPPLLDVYGSLSDAVNNEATRSRTTQARQDWKMLGDSVVKGHSYSLHAVLLSFESASLEILAGGPVVEWRLREPNLLLINSCSNPSRLVKSYQSNRESLFDRDAILRPIMGKKVRHAPDSTGVFLVWKPDYEIYFSSHYSDNAKCWLLLYG